MSSYFKAKSRLKLILIMHISLYIILFDITQVCANQTMFLSGAIINFENIIININTTCAINIEDFICK